MFVTLFWETKNENLTKNIHQSINDDVECNIVDIIIPCNVINVLLAKTTFSNIYKFKEEKKL